MAGQSVLRFPTADAGVVCEDSAGQIRSYDHRGRAFTWLPPAGLSLTRAAIDVEAKSCPAAPLSARFGLEPAAFLQRWTALEALAKVLDRPILQALKLYGLTQPAQPRWTRHAPSGVWLRGVEHPTHWITVAAII